MNDSDNAAVSTDSPKPSLHDRREVLKRAGLLLTGLATIGLAPAHADPDGNGSGDDNNDGKTGSMTTPIGKGVIDLGAVSAFALGSVKDHTAQAGVQVSRTPAGLIALSPICTHQGCTTPFSSAAREFVCPCHGARFATDGRVTAGPARTPLSRYALSIKNGRVLVDTNKLIQRSSVTDADFKRV